MDRSLQLFSKLYHCNANWVCRQAQQICQQGFLGHCQHTENISSLGRESLCRKAEVGHQSLQTCPSHRYCSGFRVLLEQEQRGWEKALDPVSAQPSACPASVLACIMWGYCTERKESALEKCLCGNCVFVNKVGYQHISPAPLSSISRHLGECEFSGGSA